MAVSTELFRSEHPWTGVETNFPTGFAAAQAAHVYGIFRTNAGAEIALVQGVNYAVQISAQKIVTCTPITMPQASGTVVFYRATPATQTIVLQDNANTPASVYQDLHDRAALRDAELKGALARSLVLPAGASETGAYEVASRQFVNIGQPTQPSHAARLVDVQNAVSQQGNVPAPSLGQVGSFLIATAEATFGWGGSQIIKNLNNANNEAAARTALGGSELGQAVFTAVNAAAARTALGGSETGQAVFTAADIAAIITLLGLADKTVPAGAVAHFAMSSPPAGWLKANGAAISRVTYAALFAAIGTAYGTGDGSTTFNLPDLRGEFLRSWDDGRGVDTGRAIGTAQAASAVLTSVTLSLGSHSRTAFAGLRSNADTEAVRDFDSEEILDGDYNSNFPSGTAGVARNHHRRIRPRNVALLACIKF